MLDHVLHSLLIPEVLKVVFLEIDLVLQLFLLFLFISIVQALLSIDLFLFLVFLPLI